jgi:hypothetical protein
VSAQKLREILEGGGEEQCLALFQGMPEKDRRQLAPTCLAWFAKVKANEYQETKPGTLQYNHRMPVAVAAVFATANLTELQKLAWRHPSHDICYRILADRRPKWVNEWVAGLLTDAYYWAHWALIRRLIAAGLIEKPDHPNYYLGMIGGIGGPGSGFQNDLSIEEHLRADPGLLRDEVWRLFEYEGGGENSLANYDRFARGEKWSDALLSLVHAGRLPRGQLLRASLDALQRDFNHYRAKWFASFYDSLQPTSDELREHRADFLHLLNVSAPPIVAWAFEKVEKLHKAGVYPPAAAIAGVPPALRSRQKGIVKKALQLLERSAQQDQACGRDIALAATVALGHEAADVQEAALDVIDRWGETTDAELASLVAERAALLSPSLRGRLERWRTPPEEQAAAASAPLADPQSSSPATSVEDVAPAVRSLMGIDTILAAIAAGRVEVPAARFDGMDIPRLDAAQRLAPIQEIDELLDVTARAIEDESLVDEAERAIDGLSRLCGQKPDDLEQRAAPLLKRARDLLKKSAFPFIGLGPGHDLCGLVYAWRTGTVLRGKREKRSGHTFEVFTIEKVKRDWFADNEHKPIGMLSQRSLAVAARLAAGKPAPLLSAPTHAGYWIDPQVLVERVNAWSVDPPDSSDVCLALLRTAPDGRAEALARLKKSSAEWSQAIRHGLGADDVSVGKTAGLWIAAARCRAPWSDDARVAQAFPDHGPDAAQAAGYAFRCKTDKRGHTSLVLDSSPSVPRTVDPACVTVAFHAQRGRGRGLMFELGGFAGRSVGAVRWTASIWPQARESFFAAAAQEIADNLDWWEAQWQNKALLEPLLDAGTPLRTMGLLLLALALAAKEPGEAGLAIDAAIRAIEDGRLDAERFGSMLAALLPVGLIKPGRWQKTLAEVARVSPLHALTVRQSLQGALRCDPERMPRDVAKLVELLHELSVDLGLPIADEACREFLSGLRGSSKTAKTARTLLALAPPCSAETGCTLMRQLLAQRRAAVRPA